MESTLGEKLKSARESAGISVDDAVYRAKFPREVVNALESEDFGFFTSPLYARSFLKQYGDYVGADVADWIDSLVSDPMIDGESVESVIDAPPENLKQDSKEKTKKSGSGALAAVWMITITAGIVWGGVQIYEKLDTQFSENEPKTSESSSSPSEGAEGIPQNQSEEEEVVAAVEQEPVDTSPERPKRAIIVNIPEEE